MKINRFLKQATAGMLAIAFAVLSFNYVPTVFADPLTQGVPDQEACESGSTTFTWDGEEIDRPVITSLFVKPDAESDPEEVSNPEVAAEDHDIAVAICPNVEEGRRSSLFVYQKIDSDTSDFDLTGAKSPTSDTVFSDETEITITVAAGDFNDLAEFFTFALVHGEVTAYETSGLGTANAAMSITFKPVRTPFGDTSGENDFDFCTATPPNCNAVKSDVDAWTASLDMTFDQTGYGEDFAGAYFAMTGAMGAWVEPVGPGGQPRSLKATLGAPHFLADGETVNVGSLQAFIPDSAIVNLFETTADEITEDTLSVTRTEGDDSDEAPFDLAQVNGGILVSMSGVTFSSPVYDIGLAGFGDDDDENDPEDEPNSRYLEDDGPASVVNLTTADGTEITAFSKSIEGNLVAQDSGYDYPFGLHSFTVTNVPLGSTQTIQLVYLTDQGPDGLVARKYSSNNSFSTIQGYELSEDMIDGQHVLVLTYQVTDGGTLDQDGEANGQIVDPVGLGRSAVGAPNTGLSPWLINLR